MHFWRASMVFITLLFTPVLARAQPPIFQNGIFNVTVPEGGDLTLSNIRVLIMNIPGLQVKLTLQLPGRTLSPKSVSSVQINTLVTITAAFGPITLADAGRYTLMAQYVDGNPGAMATSDAQLTVSLGPPVFTTQPATQTVTEGTAASFTTAVGGTAPFQYQWRKNSQPIAGATSATLTLSEAKLADSGGYDVVVWNHVGTVTSALAALTVTPASAPSITTQPRAAAVLTGGRLALEVVATGTGPLAYQWKRNGEAIAGATAPRYELAGAPVSASGVYTVVVSNYKGAVTSEGATVLVANTIPVTIAAQPTAATVAELGEPFTLAVTATGWSTLNYQWSKDGALLAGATASTLTVAAAERGDAGTYRVMVTGPAGGLTSDPAVVSVVPFGRGRLLNMSILTMAGTGLETLAVGTAVGGAGTTGGKALLVRAAGPTLGTVWGMEGTVPDPTLTLYRGVTELHANDDWAGGYNFAAVGAFPFAGSPLRDAAIYEAALATGPYSIQIAAKGRDSGLVLAEIYDATPSEMVTRATPRLVNLSARTRVNAQSSSVTVGFVVGGSTPLRLLVRAAGPALNEFGVPGTLPNPKLEIVSRGAKIAENDNWGGTRALKDTFRSVGAFEFPAESSNDSALVLQVAAGEYQAMVTGVGGGIGVVLLEVYELP